MVVGVGMQLDLEVCTGGAVCIQGWQVLALEYGGDDAEDAWRHLLKSGLKIDATEALCWISPARMRHIALTALVHVDVAP